MAKNLPFVLVVLDGLANNPSTRGNAVVEAKKPTLDRLAADCPKTELITWGARVGLPEGQMGNSEVGHLNIGGGRIVKQELTRIDEAARENKLQQLPALKEILERSRSSQNAALHLIGLVSTGGVHSSLEHLLALVKTALSSGCKRVYIHAITDGRDRPPDASLEDVRRLQDFLERECSAFKSAAEFGIVSIIGRYFAMDRDKRWERTKKALLLFTKGEGKAFRDPLEALKNELAAGKTDEFHEPLFVEQGIFKRAPVVKDGDSVIFFNFRADRMRQIVSCILPPELGGESAAPEFNDLRPKNLSIAILTEYDPKFKVPVFFPPHFVKNHFGEVVSAAGLTQLRAAETEKYPHVTYFFNGTIEPPYPGEERILIPSPRDVATYDLKPEMSAEQVTDVLLAKFSGTPPDVTIVNYANCDMVGHSGNFPAAVQAVETVDRCLGKLLAAIEKHNGTAIVTADHGNADQMVDYETGAPHTFHTMYPVPFYLFGRACSGMALRSGGALCDVAPTALEIIGVPQPSEMTGHSLILKANT